MSIDRNISRVARIRDYLASVKTARSPREILRAVEPDGVLSTMCNTLGYMAQRGYVEQLGHGKGKARFRVGIQPVVDRRARAKAAPQTQHIVPRQRTRTREQTSNFPAAPGTVTTRRADRLSASDQIAVDIAAFEARGGRIQKLGITQVFHTTAVGNDDED